MPTRQEVAEFLAAFKAAISLGYIRWLPRPADRQHLIDLGITQNQALEYIQQLTPDNRRRHVTHALIWSFHKADYPLKYPLRSNCI